MQVIGRIFYQILAHMRHSNIRMTKLNFVNKTKIKTDIFSIIFTIF